MSKSLDTEKIYFANLDGLRFFSFLLVFFSHSLATDIPAILNSYWYINIKQRLFSDGALGVSFFFVLSGFLITYLLLKEKEATGKIDIPSFYARRALRIWPLYFFCVFFGFCIFPLLKSFFGQAPNETADSILCSLFLNNFNTIINGAPDSSVLSVLWSVAIEEQFYVVWPLLFALFLPKNYLYIFIGVICASITYRIMYYGDPIDIHTLGVISDMALGGLGAYLVLKTNLIQVFFNKTPKYIHLTPYIATIAFIGYKHEIFHTPLLQIFQKMIVGPMFFWIILEQNFNLNSYFKISRLKTITTLGKYTYGLYCYHQIALLVTMVVLKKLHLNTESYQLLLIELPLSLLLSILMAYLSYHYFEIKFLKLKDRFNVAYQKASAN